MSFVFPERLIEFAIRIGTDDFQKDPALVENIFAIDPLKDQGSELTPSGATEKVFEPLVMDYFQKRLSEIPRREAEVGVSDIFGESVTKLSDILGYLTTANVKIVHGFPRSAQDLPCISITLGNEDEREYLGQLKGVAEFDSARYFILGGDWSSQYNISVIAPSYEEVLIWYHVIKYALTRYRAHLEGYGLRNQKMSWMDVEPAAEYLQAGIFMYQRSCVLALEKDEKIPVKQDAYSELEFGIVGVAEGQYGTIIPDPE